MLLAPWVASAQATVTTYAVAPVRVGLSEGQTVGAMKAGALCLPAGSVGWGEVSEVGGDRSAAIAAGLQAAGLSVSAGNTAGRRVEAEIVALSADLCRPQYGLLKLGSTGLKGSGRITIRWRVSDSAGRAVLDEAIEARFSVRSSGRSLGPVLPAALKAAAAALGRRLAGADR